MVKEILPIVLIGFVCYNEGVEKTARSAYLKMNTSAIIQFIQNFSSTSFNLVALSLVIVVGVFYAWLLNRDKILSILFATYVSFGLTAVFPYDLWFGDLSFEKLILFKLILFVGGVILLSIIFILCRAGRGREGGFFIWRWIKSILFALVQIGLFLSILMTLLPIEWLLKISFEVQQIFISPLAKFIWFVVPIAVLMITKKARRCGPGRPLLL